MLKQPSAQYRGLGSVGNNALQREQQAWWMPFFPGAAIFLTVLSFNLAGEAINDAMRPRR